MAILSRLVRCVLALGGATFAIGSPEVAAAGDFLAGRIVHYSFDAWENSTLVQDSSGRRNQGTPVNFDFPPATQAGQDGNGFALVFDRHRQQRVDVGAGAESSLDLSRFTISAWARLAELDTDEKTGRSPKRPQRIA